MQNYSRIDWIDFLRAIAIVLVVYGHCVPNSSYWFFLCSSPVKMPLFFAISGYLLKDSLPITTFLKKTFSKLVVPWLFLGLFPVLFLMPVKGVCWMFDYLLKMVVGDVLWFMPCFIIGQVIFFSIRKYVKKDIFCILTVIICSVLGFILFYNNLGNKGMINRALIVQIFFLIGFLFKKNESVFIGIKRNILIILFLVYFILCVCSSLFFPGQTIDVHLNYYYNIPFCFVHICLGTLLLFIICSKNNLHLRFINGIGRNTFVIYMWHGYSIIVLLKIVDGLELKINDVYSSLLKTFFACCICYIVSLLLNRFFPYLVGKSK